MISIPGRDGLPGALGLGITPCYRIGYSNVVQAD